MNSLSSTGPGTRLPLISSAKSVATHNTISPRVKAIVAFFGIALFGGIIALDETAPRTKSALAESATIYSFTRPFGVGDMAPPMTIHVASPMTRVGQSIAIGWGHDQEAGHVPTVVGIFGAAPRCACGALRSALNRLAAAKFDVAPTILGVDASHYAVANHTTTDEQYGFDLGLRVPFGYDADGSVAQLWADEIVPSIIVVDHDDRVRYIARGGNVGNTIALDRALRASVSHYMREHPAGSL